MKTHNISIRTCIFSSDIDKVENDKISALNVDTSFISPNFKNNIYVTGYKWPASRSVTNKIYPLENRNKLRVKVCCNLLDTIDHFKWIPSWTALIALYAIKRETISTILSFAPDLLIISGLRWTKEFNKIIKKNIPQLPTFSELGPVPPVCELKKKHSTTSKVSIVLPTYNGAKFIRKSIESCLKQSHKNLELIIVDDCSTDETAQIIQSYKDQRIKYVKHKKNLKLPSALNTGFKKATGDYLTWTSDDNIFEENAIEVMIGVLSNYSYIDYVYTDYYQIDENDQIMKYISVGKPERLKVGNEIGACFLYRKKVYDEIGDYDPKTFLAEDYDYWIRIYNRFKMQLIRIPLYYFRVHRDSLTSNFGILGSNQAKKIEENIKKNIK